MFGSLKSKLYTALLLTVCTSGCADEQTLSLKERVALKNYPAVFQAWNPLDMPSQYPAETHQAFLDNAAKHDLLWEEPVSQLGFDTKLAIGLNWDHEYPGLATSFTESSLNVAQENLRYMHSKNPHMVTLFEVRWRDAPGSYLPEDSDFWLRNEEGQRVAGWDGGPEPYYMLNYKHEAFQHRIGEQARAVIESGVYDGVMLDWSGYLPIVKLVREYIGDEALLTVNIHDDINDGEMYKDYINGAFMECGPNGRMPQNKTKLCSWESMAKALEYFESNFRHPTVNALEAWGLRGDLRSMRRVTTLGLTHSDGYVLFADYNPMPTPDHMHDWYPEWSVKLGQPNGDMAVLSTGIVYRSFENGVVYYNPPGSQAVEVKFQYPHKSVSSGDVGVSFVVGGEDGEIFIRMP